MDDLKCAYEADLHPWSFHRGEVLTEVCECVSKSGMECSPRAHPWLG